MTADTPARTPSDAVSEDLTNRLRNKSAMINLGEKIAWGSETALMDDAADIIAALREKLEAAERDRDAAINALVEAAAARGRAEGRLAASEMAGVLDGWKQRAEAAEAALTTARAEGAAAWLAGRDAALRIAQGWGGCARDVDMEREIAALTPPADLTAALDEVRRQERAAGRKAGLLEAAAVVSNTGAEKCGGEGWLWRHEMDVDPNPDAVGQDDCRYSCDCLCCAIRALAEQGGEA